MLIKTLESRVVRRSREDLEALRLTSAVFTSCVGAFVTRYLEALRGRPSPLYRELMRRLLQEGGPHVYGIVDGLSALQWKSVAAGPLPNLARRIRDEEGLWFDRFQEIARHDGNPVRTSGRARPASLPGAITVSPEMYRQAVDAGAWYLRALFAARKGWREERREWLENRSAFLAEHPHFVRALSTWITPFEERFTRAQTPGGPRPQHGQRWDRWSRWYTWLVEHPECIGWRGADQPLTLPTSPALAAIDRETRHPGRRAQLRLRLLLDLNPELAALEELRLRWVQTYLRFRRPPATRIPGERAEARALVFQRQRAFRELDTESGSVALQVLCPDDSGGISPQWRTYEIRSDPRFSDNVRARRGLPALETEIAGRASIGEPYVDSAGERKAGLSGLTLIERRGIPYLVASIPTSVPRLRLTFGHNASARVPADRLVDREKRPVSTARLLALHLSTDPPASYVACAVQRLEETSEWTLQDLARGAVRLPHSPSFRQVLQEDRRRRTRLAQWGTPPAGERFDAELSAHRRNSTRERQRATAAAVVSLAQLHQVDMILVDDLRRRTPSAATSRDRNRLLALWNPQGLVDWLELLARDVGIALGFSSPSLGTVLCSRCGLPGFRFRVRRKNAGREGVTRRAQAQDFGKPELDPEGPEFRCPHCERTENAAVNAARNHVLQLTRGRHPGLKLQPRTGAWTLPDGRKRWSPAVAAEAWFETLRNPSRPSSPPPT